MPTSDSFEASAAPPRSDGLGTQSVRTDGQSLSGPAKHQRWAYAEVSAEGKSKERANVKRVLKCSFLGLALAVGTSAAHADPWWHHHHDPPKPEPRKAPEVDPNMAIGGLSLLGGTIAVLRAQRSK